MSSSRRQTCALCLAQVDAQGAGTAYLLHRVRNPSPVWLCSDCAREQRRWAGVYQSRWDEQPMVELVTARLAGNEEGGVTT